VDALSNALGGMHGAGLRLDVAADNVANVTTPGFRPSRADGGVVRLGEAPPAVPGVPDEEQPSGVDLVAETATLVTAPITYAANARLVRAARERDESLFDALA
jgi:flagellar basal body rod protein FlgG